MGNHVNRELNPDYCRFGLIAGQGEGTMRIGKGIIAAGITIGAIGVSFATAGAAAAAPVTYPTVVGVITGPHTFTLEPGEVVVVGETLRPNTPAYFANVPVVAVTTSPKGVTTVTTGYTFLPLNRINKVTTFTVIPPVP
jgi:hypothetical protein